MSCTAKRLSIDCSEMGSRKPGGTMPGSPRSCHVMSNSIPRRAATRLPETNKFLLCPFPPPLYEPGKRADATGRTEQAAAEKGLNYKKIVYRGAGGTFFFWEFLEVLCDQEERSLSSRFKGFFASVAVSCMFVLVLLYPSHTTPHTATFPILDI